MGAPTDMPTGGTTAPAPAGGPSSADILARIENLAVGGDSNEPQPIGGYVGPAHPGSGARIALTGPTGATPVPQQMEQNAAIYYEGDERIPASYSVEDIAALQKGMAASGLLNGAFRLGIWDKKSRSAFTELLGFANQQRVPWVDALNIYASSPELGGSREDEFTPGKFLPRDPAEYRNTVRDMFRSALDRDPDDDELARYEAELRGVEKSSFRAAKGEFEEVTGQGGEMGAEEFGQTLSREEAGAAARFKERFEQRVAPEVEFKTEQLENAEQGGLLGGILGTIDQVA